MSQQTDLTTKPATEMQNRWENSELAIRPAVNIVEDASGIVVEADMPGVAKEGLSIQVDKDKLAVEGKAYIEMPAGLEPLYADVRTTRYQFTFALSNELDTTNIAASLKDGVLELHLPKRAELKPRKIDVRVG